MTFADRLQAAIARTANPCCVGIDPHLDLLPDEFATARDTSATLARRADAVSAYCRELVAVVAERAPIVKPQSAFFEALGSHGVRAWEETVNAARDAGVLVLGDVKRGDIGSTAKAYAQAYLTDRGAARCDAITVNAYLGGDSMQPFLDAAREFDGGLFVLVRTSNPGSADFQEHGEPELAAKVADAVDAWGAELVGECGMSSVGAVIGATHPDVLARFRSRMPRATILLPGYGAQGAGASDVVGAFLDATPPTRGALVSASRSVAFAHRREEFAGRPWREAVSAALDEMIAHVGGALAAV